MPYKCKPLVSIIEKVDQFYDWTGKHGSSYSLNYPFINNYHYGNNYDK